MLGNRDIKLWQQNLVENQGMHHSVLCFVQLHLS